MFDYTSVSLGTFVSLNFLKTLSAKEYSPIDLEYSTFMTVAHLNVEGFCLFH